MLINKLAITKRVQILSMLCEGSSMRSISRVVDVSINTVHKSLAEEGRRVAVRLMPVDGPAANDAVDVIPGAS